MQAHQKQKVYWLCQTVGWACIVGQQILALSEIGYLKGRFWAFPLLIFPIGIGLTHGYRWLFIRLKLFEKDTFTLLWTGGAAVFALSCGMFLTHHKLGHWLSGSPEPGTFLHVATNITHWSPIFFGWVAVYHLDKILTRLHSTEVHRLRASGQLRESQLQNLRAQLNPHFLFNALNSIRALAFSEPARAADAIGQLSDLLRATLHAPAAGWKTLGEEILFVESYLQLEKIRFDERLDWQVDLKPAFFYQKLPSLLLLTLVENAVKHGIGTLPGGGKIRIWAGDLDGGAGWFLNVWNDGFLTADHPERGEGGLGLENARQRLAHFFGPGGARLTLENQPDGGVLAAVQMFKKPQNH